MNNDTFKFLLMLWRLICGCVRILKIRKWVLGERLFILTYFAVLFCDHNLDFEVRRSRIRLLYLIFEWLMWFPECNLQKWLQNQTAAWKSGLFVENVTSISGSFFKFFVDRRIICMSFSVHIVVALWSAWLRIVLSRSATNL